MAREYFHAYHSYLETTEALSDAEKGRLFTACLIYSKTGKAPRLSGNERFVFPGLKAQIDRDTEAYDEKCRINKENGKKSAAERPPFAPQRPPNAPQGKGKGKGKGKGEDEGE